MNLYQARQRLEFAYIYMSGEAKLMLFASRIQVKLFIHIMIYIISKHNAQRQATQNRQSNYRIYTYIA